MALPKGFTDLATAFNSTTGAFVNIIGVVVDIMPLKTTSTGDLTMSFKLLDKHIQNSIYGSQGLSVRFFIKPNSQHLMPAVTGHGDVVLMRNAKMSKYAGQPVAMSNYQTNTMVFHANAIPLPNYSIAYQGNNRLKAMGIPEVVETLTLEEQAYVISLKAEIRSAVTQIPQKTVADFTKQRDVAATAANTAPLGPKAKASFVGPKFKLIESLRHRNFADLCVEVVKKYSKSITECELYVTDYTANEEMWYYTPPEEEMDYQRDGDAFGYNQPSKKSWPGPYGFLVLKVNVKDPHASYCNREVKEGDIVFLQNVKMKIMDVGAKLEGDMWPDSMNPGKIQASTMTKRDWPQIKELKLRKEEYLASRRTNQSDKPGEPGLSKKQKKKLRRKEREREQQLAAEAAQAALMDLDSGRTDGVNKHVRCGYRDVSLSTVRDILDPENLRHTNTSPTGQEYVLPFINAKYRTRVRIVDYWPKDLRDFAQPALPDDEESEQSPINTIYSVSQKWEWYFCLTLEDASPSSKRINNKSTPPERMEAHLGHEEAQYLLGKDIEDPQNLRSNRQLLAKLKEKLCILWGNLAEKKEDEELSNMPFECCVFEYGVEMDEDDPEKDNVPFGWKKMFRMFQTTIS
jgi:protection of telomeres protein 1